MSGLTKNWQDHSEEMMLSKYRLIDPCSGASSRATSRSASRAMSVGSMLSSTDAISLHDNGDFNVGGVSDDEFRDSFTRTALTSKYTANITGVSSTSGATIQVCHPLYF